MTADKPKASDMAALAAEAFDLWQEHLAVSASDKAAKAELMRLLEPTRRMFADWTGMMQNAAHANASTNSTTRAAPGPAPAGSAPIDRDQLILQLADRLAGFEKRLARLETRKLGPVTKTPRKVPRRRPRV